MTSTPDLPVPDAALDALADYDRAPAAMTDAPREVAVRAIATPVVAAALRAEADRLDREAAATPWQDLDKNAVRADTLVEVARGWRARAGELEDGGR